MDAEGHAFYWDSPYIHGCWHGAGDVFASALLAADIKGRSLEEALKFSVEFTARCIRRTCDAGTDERLGLQFEPELGYFASVLNV